MAISLAHKFGQIIGDLLERVIAPSLQQFADANKLYLDKKGDRTARKTKLLSWHDAENNKHDLDFVLEKNGTDTTIGNPVAFIEIAWRRYTKHSKNKAQEIQGAVLPLAAHYKDFSPFKGAILAGEFSKSSLTQLTSSGFCVLYFPYDSVIAAFAKYNIDASSNESTSEAEFQAKIDAWEKSGHESDISNELTRINAGEIADFITCLSESINRKIEAIIIYPLHGKMTESNDIKEAILFLDEYDEGEQTYKLSKYEISVRYNNGDRIDGSFKGKRDAIAFLETYQ